MQEINGQMKSLWFQNYPITAVSVYHITS